MPTPTKSNHKKWCQFGRLIILIAGLGISNSTLEAAKNGKSNKGDTNEDTTGTDNGDTTGDTTGTDNGDTTGDATGTDNGDSSEQTEDNNNGNANGNSKNGDSAGSDDEDTDGEVISNSHLIGVGATTDSPRKIYLKNGWNVSGSYTVVGPTIMVIDGDLDIGNNEIEILSTASLELYVSGSIKVNGKGGINNTGQPANLLVFGTQPELDPTDTPTESFTLSGNGAMTGVVYAPNAEYRTNGGGNAGFTSGSIVALKVVFNGSPGPFHFDVALSELILPFGGYVLNDYELLSYGNPDPTDSAKEIFGSSDYETLFGTLF